MLASGLESVGPDIYPAVPPYHYGISQCNRSGRLVLLNPSSTLARRLICRQRSHCSFAMNYPTSSSFPTFCSGGA
jgi:hypothetical protein